MDNLKIRDELQDLLDQGAHFYCGHSGGKDSQAMYNWLHTRVPEHRLHVVHADLGEVEWEGVKEHIRDTIHKRPLMIARAIHADGSPKSFFTAVLQRRAKLDTDGKTDAPAFPSSASRYCTSDLKTGPIWKVIKRHAKNVGASVVVNCVGIRGEESPARAKKIQQRGTLNANSKNTSRDRKAYDWWPIAHWSIDEVWHQIAEAGQRRHRAYDQGNDRLSCVFCIFGSTGDLQRGAAARPDLLAQYIELETLSRGTMFNGASILDRIEAVNV
jgi:3'-phosphoadenosine 5'-phosphosulfate sulfotransferase (PAPS reductase)/FAD synthetase